MRVLRPKCLLGGVLVTAAGSVLLTGGQARADPVISGATSSGSELDPVVPKDEAMQVMAAYCVYCHGPETRNGDIRGRGADGRAQVVARSRRG